MNFLSRMFGSLFHSRRDAALLARIQSQPDTRSDTPKTRKAHCPGPVRAFARVQWSRGKRKRARARRMNHKTRRAMARHST